MIRFRSLGGLELRNEEGIEVRSVLAQARRTALLASMSLPGGSDFVRRDTLMGRLWPDSPQERARHSLNQALYGLRRSLGGKAVMSMGDEEVGLDPDLVWCDVRAFQVALREGREKEALELYRGELLPGFFLSGARAFEAWLEGERMGLRTSAVGAAWALSERAERAESSVEAVSWARRAVTISGQEEVGVQRLLRLLARAGDRAAAVSTYEAFARRIGADPGVEPSPETRALIQEIRGARPEPAPTSFPRSNVAHFPRPGSPLVGRDPEIRRLQELLEDPHARLITVTGPGGVGKTRLAVELLLRADQGGAKDVWFVPLVGVVDPELVPATVGQTLGLAVEEGDRGGALRRHLHGRAGLLVLDNMEHLLEGGAFVTELLDGAPGLSVVATSREPLGLRGEWVLPLEGLEIPDGDDEDPGSRASVRLFTTAARRMTGTLRLDQENLRTIARICRLVDGIPLAIELAAGWSRAMSLEEIEGEIQASRRFLARRFRGGPDRHGSLEATFERSWSLLNPHMQNVLSRLSVLRGGIVRSAAQEVAGASLEDLAALVDKSLLQCLSGGRYALLEVIREFAAEKLAEDPQAKADALRCHALHFARFLDGLRPGLAGPQKDDALALAAEEMENLRAAWRTASREGLLSALGPAADPLFTVYDCRGWYLEAEGAFRDALQGLPAPEDFGGDLGERTSVEGRLLARRGAALLRLGRGPEGEPLLKRALALATEIGDREEAAFALDRLSLILCEKERFKEAVQLQQEALSLRRTLDDPRQVATSLNNLGSLHYAMGRHPEAREYLDECLALQRRLGDLTGEVISLQNLGQIALAQADRGTANDLLQASLTAARRLRHGVLTARSLLGLGTVANAHGRPVEARRYFQPALARAMQIGAESLAAEAILGMASALGREGKASDALELVAALLAHPDLDPGNRASGERLLDHLRDALPPDVADEALKSGSLLSLREAATRVAGHLPVD